MVSVLHTSEVVMFYAEQSLLFQLAEWVRQHPAYSLRVVSARSEGAIDSAVADAALAIIDAAENPGRAIDALQIAAARLGHDNVVVYTERTNDALEVVVRVRGSKLLLGPMTALEWEAFFEHLDRYRVAMAKFPAAKSTPLNQTVSLPAALTGGEDSF